MASVKSGRKVTDDFYAADSMDSLLRFDSAPVLLDGKSPHGLRDVLAAGAAMC